MARPFMMYGSFACEDTALIRDRARTLRLPFQEKMQEDDPIVAELVSKYNAGKVITPTLVFGNDKIVLAEPTLEKLESTCLQAGHTFAAPQAIQLRTQPNTLELASLPAYRSPTARPSPARPDKRVVFFAHSDECRVCQGYAKQLAMQIDQYAESNAHLQIVLRAHLIDLEKWSRDFAPNVELLADVDGSFKRAYADALPDALNARSGGTWLVVLDRDETPRIGVYGSDAGGLITPTQIIQGLKDWNF